MAQTKTKQEVLIAFLIGLAAGAGGVAIVTLRQVDTEHRQAIRMAGAAQQAQAMGRADIIRAQTAAAYAWQSAHKSAEKEKRAEEDLRRQLQATHSRH